MASSFLGIEIGKRGLMQHQTGMDVIGHNLANADNDFYSRQRVHPTSVVPLYDPSLNRPERAGQIGQGSEVTAIRRDRDIYLDIRISEEIANREYWTARKDMITQMEDIHDSMGDVNLQVKLDNFWKGWQKLARNPGEPAVRQDLYQDAVSLTTSLNHTFRRMNELRLELNEKIISNVRTVNQMARAIADLNTRIQESKALGDDPNDVLDKRDQLVEQLSELVNVRSSYKDDDEIMVFVDGKMMVQGSEYFPIETRDNPDNEGLVDLYWTKSGDRFETSSGRILAHIEARDVHLKNQICNIDAISNNLVYTVNRIHSEGFDNYGNRAGDFFVVKSRGTDPFGNYDSDGDDVVDRTYLYQVSGDQKLDGDQIIGENGQITLSSLSGEADVVIPYKSDERISSIVSRINLSGGSVNAYLDKDGLLVFKSRSSDDRKGFAIKHLEDSGNFLTGVAGVLNTSGAEGSYDYRRINEYQKLKNGMASADRSPETHAAGWIAVNEKIGQDPNLIAASDGTDYDGVGGKEQSFGQGDGSLARRIADIRFKDIMIDEKATFNEYYTAMVDYLGNRGHASGLEIEKLDAVLDNLKNIRESISGVNVDEEMANMLAMQHGYKAAARVVTVMDNLLDTIINRMAV